MASTDQTGAVATAFVATPEPGSAPYGRVCLNCAKAKCKCLIRSGSSNCERCLRLGKECHSPEGIRRQNRTAYRLEQKVDDILSLVKSMNEVTKAACDNTSISRGSSNFVTDGDQSRAVQDKAGRPNIARNMDRVVDQVALSSKSSIVESSPGVVQVTSSNTGSPIPAGFACNAGELLGSSHCSPFEPSADEAEKYLTYFRTQSLANFAFICLPASITAQHLRQERPFLFLTIMAVSSTSASQRLGLGLEIKKMVAADILAEKEGKLDVLLGLLVFLAWGHDQYASTPLMSRFMHLAISMVFDLRLNKPPLKHQFTIFDLVSQDGNKDQRIRTMEERRAVLGCFLLSSVVSWYFTKIDTLRWTTHMDECLQVLSSVHESPTDEMFVHQVRLQLIAEKVTQTSSINTESDQSKAEMAQLPFYLNAFRSQLEDVKGNISPEAGRNQILLAYIHHTDIFINALALSKGATITGFERVVCLSRCLNSIKSWIEIFFRIPVSHYLGSSFPFATQLMYSIVILHRLSTFEDPAWDKAMVRSTVDILVILDRIISHFRQVGNDGIDNSEPVMFDNLALVFESVRSWSKSKLIGNASGTNDVLNMQAMEENTDAPMHDIPVMNAIDDMWLGELFGPWSYETIHLSSI